MAEGVFTKQEVINYCFLDIYLIKMVKTGSQRPNVRVKDCDTCQIYCQRVRHYCPFEDTDSGLRSTQDPRGVVDISKQKGKRFKQFS